MSVWVVAEDTRAGHLCLLAYAWNRSWPYELCLLYPDVQVRALSQDPCGGERLDPVKSSRFAGFERRPCQGL